MTQWGLDTLFNPAKRHMDEEKRRLQSTREEIGDSSGGKRIDLESGKVSISKATSAEEESVDESADETAAAAKADAAPRARKRANGSAPVPIEESPARARARARRSRS